ncbi:hypothetical protein [Nocardioides sp. AN3]
MIENDEQPPKRRRTLADLPAPDEATVRKILALLTPPPAASPPASEEN